MSNYSHKDALEFIKSKFKDIPDISKKLPKDELVLLVIYYHLQYLEKFGIIITDKKYKKRYI